jgi:hypothetical protein
MAGASARPLSFTVRGRVGVDARCQFCSLVTTVAFWGPRPQRSWNRPVMLVLSLVSTAGFGSLLWIFRARWMPWGRQDLSLGLLLLVVLFSALCLLVSIRGCDACVARLFGDL